MAYSKGYGDFVVVQLGRVCPVTAKAMFGGVGLYAEGLFFALIAEDRLYFKVNDSTRGDYESRGMEPFRPFGEESAMGYYELTADVLEEPAQLELWMRTALTVAAAARGARPAKPKAPKDYKRKGRV